MEFCLQQKWLWHKWRKKMSQKTNEMILSTHHTKWSPTKLYSKFVSNLEILFKIMI